MKAVAVDRFGGVDTLAIHTLPVPDVGPDEILIRVEEAGVGVWDPMEREGGFAKMSGAEPKFPYVLGSDGAGTVVAVGSNVDRFAEGDRVYAVGLANPKGGFYAQYAAVKAEYASRIPEKLTVEQAAVMPVDAITALRGLDDTLHLEAGESLAVVGAGGGVGHLAVQLAQRMGARVLAVASGEDGVKLAKSLGADAVVEGHHGDLAAAVKAFAPDGLDAALLTTGGKAAREILSAMREGGRAAYPHGVSPEPEAPSEAPSRVSVQGYDGTPDHEVIEELDRLIEAGPFTVHVARTFALEDAAEAQRALEEHYLGKLALRTGASTAKPS